MIVLFTNGEYSDYHIVDVLEVPSREWVNEQFRSWRTTNVQARYGDGFLQQLASHPGVRRVECAEAWLGGSFDRIDRGDLFAGGLYGDTTSEDG